MTERPIKICFVSANSYPVINPQAPGLFGGMETLAWTFAREIAAIPETEVTFVVVHRSAPRLSRVEGVQVLEVTDLMEWYRQDVSQAWHSFKNSGRLPLVRLPTLVAKLAAYFVTRPFRHKPTARWTTISTRLTRLNADIYVAFGVNSQSLWTAISARAARRPFVLCLMSDFDVDRRFCDDPDYVNQYGVTSATARRVIRDSDGIVAQTEFQQRQLRDVWQTGSTIVSNPLDLSFGDSDAREPLPANTPSSPFVLWVGRADRFHKRPLEMLRAVDANPEIPFLLVLYPSDPEVFNQVIADHRANLTIIPQVSPRQMAALMRAATVFATTGSSAFEGLPSTLMEAAAAGTPIVSLEVSEEWLASSGAGVCTRGDHEAFATAIRQFVRDRDSPEIRQHAEAGRRYVEREHTAAQQAAKLRSFLVNLA